MLVFILIDMVVGNLRALIIDKDWKSKVFRLGLYKKASEIAIVIVALLFDEYCKNLINKSLNLYFMTSVYVVVMEFLSILENFSDNKDLLMLISTMRRVVDKFKKDNGGDGDES